jgi:hypothetical protein
MSAEYLQTALARRTRTILVELDDPLKAMRELEGAACAAGLLQGGSQSEGMTPAEFSDYLWLANPIATPWLESCRSSISRPQMIKDVAGLMTVLSS